MPWPTFSKMTQYDLTAIYTYLSAIPCIEGPTDPADPLHNDCGSGPTPPPTGITIVITGPGGATSATNTFQVSSNSGQFGCVQRPPAPIRAPFRTSWTIAPGYPRLGFRAGTPQRRPSNSPLMRDIPVDLDSDGLQGGYGNRHRYLDFLSSARGIDSEAAPGDRAASDFFPDGIVLIKMTENGSGRKSVESRAAKTIREIFESGRPLTYIRSSEEQRVARVLRGGGMAAAGVACRFGPGASPRACVAAGKPPRRPALKRRAACSTSSSPTRARHLPPQGFSRAAARIAGDPAAPARRVRELSATRGSSSSSLRRCASFPRSWSAASCFSNCGRPIVIELVEFLRGRSARTPAMKSLHQVARALQGLTLDEARYALRRALADGPESGTRVAAGAARREAAAGQSQRRDRVHCRRHESGRGRRPGRPEEMAAGAPQAVSDARQPEREIVPKGLLMMGIPGCGKSLVREGHRVVISSCRCIAWT